ncbi:MAG: Archaeal ATPase [uncultured bacterium]|nr:MAG: Archaeal ATPase [uncultured bacterium]HBY01256.1 hypothetical protein [Rikenellaceae bacterium]
MDSPFIYNNIVTGSDFISRTHELNQLSNLIKEQKCAVIYEPAKSGKQSLIQQAFIKVKGDSHKFKVCHINLFNVRTEEKLYQKLREGLLKTFSKTGSDVIIPDEQNEANEGQGKKTFSCPDELIKLGERFALEADVYLIIYFEEFQEVLHFEDPDTTLKKLERTCAELLGKNTNKETIEAEGVSDNKGRRTSLLFSGSFVNAMKEIFDEKRYFYNMATRVKFNKIDERNFCEHIIRSFLKAGRVVSKELATHIYSLTDGHPWYTQQLADIAFGLTRGYLMESIINQAFDLLIVLHSYRFRLITSRLSLFQLNLLKAILDDVEKLSSAEILDKYNLQSSANVNRLKDAVQKKEIVEFIKGKGEFLDPLFKTWMKEIYFAN